MENVALSSKNHLASGVTAYGDQDVAFPRTNLFDPVFSKVWRYTPGTNADGNTAKLAFSVPVFRAAHLAFCRHNMGKSGQIRLRAGTARLDFDFTSDAPLFDTTLPEIAFGGGVNGTRTNEFGVMLTGQSCPRYDHSRRYFENGLKWSEDLNQSAWGVLGGAVKQSDGRTVVFERGNPSPSIGSELYQQVGDAGQQIYADTYEARVQVRLVEGNGDFAFQIYDASVYTQSATQTATSEWRWVTATIVVAAPAKSQGQYFYIHKLTARGVLQLRKFQLRRGSGGGKYRKTTSSRLFQRLGIMDEGASTNSLLHSSDMTNAVWAKSPGATVLSNVVTAPDNTVTMDRLTFAAAPDFFAQDLALAGTSLRCASKHFYASAGNATSIDFYLQWYSGGGSQAVYVRFNPQTGAVTSKGAYIGAPTFYDGGVEDLGNGYFRVWVIGQGTDAANTLVRTGLTNVAPAGGFLPVWGWQNEPTNYSSYIPTTTAAVTRTAQTGEVESGTWAPYAINMPEGTVYLEYQQREQPTGPIAITELRLYNSVGPSTEYVSLQHWFHPSSTTGFANPFAVTAGVTSWSTSLTACPVSGSTKLAVRWRSTDFRAYMNGVALAQTTNNGVPNGINRISLFGVGASAPNLRHVKKLTIWRGGKADADLQALSTSGPGAVDFDSGWADVAQMQEHGDLPTLWGRIYPIIKTFSARALEWVRIELYDPDKTSASTPFEIGYAFMGKVTVQPALDGGVEYGLANGWNERTTFTQAVDGRKFFNEMPRIREVAFACPFLTHAEGAAIHEMQGTGGIVEETLYLPDPSDEAECQRYGFVGHLQQLDPIKYPMFATRSAAFQMAEKR